MIEIQDIKTNNIKDIINHLLKEKKQSFEIFIPKSTQLFFSTSSDIANEYAMLAFAGQKLSEVADEFSYYHASFPDYNGVVFEIKTNSVDKLAKTILNISYGYDNEPAGEEVYYFDEVYDFIEKVETEKIIPVCPDFIEDYREYYEEDEENYD